MNYPGLDRNTTKYASRPLPCYMGFRVGLVGDVGLPEIKGSYTVDQIHPRLRTEHHPRKFSEILMPERTAILMNLPKTANPFDRDTDQVGHVRPWMKEGRYSTMGSEASSTGGSTLDGEAYTRPLPPIDAVALSMSNRNRHGAKRGMTPPSPSGRSPHLHSSIRHKQGWGPEME